MIRTILVANRGEIASRIFATARRLGIQTIAVYSDADARAPFALEADRAVRLPGNAPAETYLDIAKIIAAAKATGADAVHPGYGFLSENAEFAKAVTDAGMRWIGPRAETITAMGSKVRAKDLMAQAGVPVLSVDADSVSESDYPLIVKASAGGGGRGMRIVQNPDDLAAEIQQASAEAESAFGDGQTFVEPYLATARHIEVQIIADQHGTIWVLGDRDCSLQRRHQKVIEEAPAPNVSAAVREQLHRAARAAAEAIGYVSAGTVEFLVENASETDGRVFFLEMNTRLQVEHPVTEMVTGTDIVALQVAIAEGHALDNRPPSEVGHAIEVRLYAEDPFDDWQPQTGVVREFTIPGIHFEVGPAPVLRVDAGIAADSNIGIHYDPMLAKIIAYAPDRSSAIRLLDDALRRMRLHGVGSNAVLLRKLLGDANFVAANVHTGSLAAGMEQWTGENLASEATRKAVTAAALAHAAHDAQTARVLHRIPPAYRNVPSQAQIRRYLGPGGEHEVQYRAERGRLHSDEYQILDVRPDQVLMTDGGVTERYCVTVGSAIDVSGPDGSFDFEPVPRFTDPADQIAEGSLLAPLPASVTSVAVEEGQSVSQGDVVLVLEAMKMQHTISAPYNGQVTQLAVAVGAQVDADTVLAIIEPEGQ